MMTKQEKFLWIVQTCLLSNAINLSASDKGDEFRHEISATGQYGNAQDAIFASERIPEGLSAEDAAYEFVFFICSNLRGETAQCPAWFTR
jgi:hypothetical protein